MSGDTISSTLILGIASVSLILFFLFFCFFWLVHKSEKSQEITAKYLEEAVYRAFIGDNERSIVEKYLERIYSNSQVTETALRKSITRIFLLFFVFFLLTEAIINQMDIGPIKLNNFNLIIKILPLVIAINYYELVSLYSAHILQVIMIRVIFETFYNPIVKRDLQTFLYPSSMPDYSYAILNQMRGKRGILDVLDNSLYMLFSMTIILAGIIFECLVFYECFQKFGLFDPLLWLITMVALLFVIESAIHIYTLFYDFHISRSGEEWLKKLAR